MPTSKCTNGRIRRKRDTESVEFDIASRKMTTDTSDFESSTTSSTSSTSTTSSTTEVMSSSTSSSSSTSTSATSTVQPTPTSILMTTTSMKSKVMTSSRTSSSSTTSSTSSSSTSTSMTSTVQPKSTRTMLTSSTSKSRTSRLTSISSVSSIITKPHLPLQASPEPSIQTMDSIFATTTLHQLNSTDNPDTSIPELPILEPLTSSQSDVIVPKISRDYAAVAKLEDTSAGLTSAITGERYKISEPSAGLLPSGYYFIDPDSSLWYKALEPEGDYILPDGDNYIIIDNLGNAHYYKKDCVLSKTGCGYWNQQSYTNNPSSGYVMEAEKGVYDRVQYTWKDGSCTDCILVPPKAKEDGFCDDLGN